MKIDISNINKETFEQILIEDCERCDIHLKMFTDALNLYKDTDAYNDYLNGYNTLISRKETNQRLISEMKTSDEIEINDNELEHFKYALEDNIYYSNSRLKDLCEGGMMYKIFEKHLINKDDFDKAIKVSIEFENNLIECSNTLLNLIF